MVSVINYEKKEHKVFTSFFISQWEIWFYVDNRYIVGIGRGSVGYPFSDLFIGVVFILVFKTFEFYCSFCLIFFLITFHPLFRGGVKDVGNEWGLVSIEDGTSARPRIIGSLIW